MLAQRAIGRVALSTVRLTAASSLRSFAPVAARSFATSNSLISESDLKAEAEAFREKSEFSKLYGPKITFPGTSGEYARDLFTQSGAAGQRNQVYQDILSLKPILAQAEFQHFVLSSSPAELQKEVKNWFNYNKLHAITKQFLDTLFQKNQFKLLISIVPKFLAMIEKDLGIVELELTLASVPSQSELRDILKRLESAGIFSSNQQLKLNIVIDPTILGGLLANTPTMQVDWSQKTKYYEFKRNLEDTGKRYLGEFRSKFLSDFPKTWDNLPLSK